MSATNVETFFFNGTYNFKTDINNRQITCLCVCVCLHKAFIFLWWIRLTKLAILIQGGYRKSYQMHWIFQETTQNVLIPSKQHRIYYTILVQADCVLVWKNILHALEYIKWLQVHTLFWITVFSCNNTATHTVMYLSLTTQAHIQFTGWTRGYLSDILAYLWLY